MKNKTGIIFLALSMPSLLMPVFNVLIIPSLILFFVIVLFIGYNKGKYSIINRLMGVSLIILLVSFLHFFILEHYARKENCDIRNQYANEEKKSLLQIQSVFNLLIIHTRDNNDQLPKSIDLLVDDIDGLRCQKIFKDNILTSPNARYDEKYKGKSSYVLLLQGKLSTYSPDDILLYEKTKSKYGGRAVMFADGHCGILRDVHKNGALEKLVPGE